MGYLQLDSGIANFSKAVISLWFRIPVASVAAAQSQFTSAGVDSAISDGVAFDYNLLGIIPLITWGPNPVATNTFAGSTSISPCFIGVNCGPYFIDSPPNSFPTTPNLAIGFSYSGQDFIGEFSTVPNYFQIGRGATTVLFTEGTPFNNVPGDDSTRILVASDRWHHVLLSFDLDHGDPDPSTDPCKCWLAFDGVNKNGLYLWPASAGPPLGPGGPNDIVQNSSGYGQANGALQASGYPLGIPCTSDNVDRVYNIEMAELQFYTGVTLDTSVLANRRLFVDGSGLPVRDTSAAITALGQSPDILLQGDTNWIGGINTGVGESLNPLGSIATYPTPPHL